MKICVRDTDPVWQDHLSKWTISGRCTPTHIAWPYKYQKVKKRSTRDFFEPKYGRGTLKFLALTFWNNGKPKWFLSHFCWNKESAIPHPHSIHASNKIYYLESGFLRGKYLCAFLSQVTPHTSKVTITKDTRALLTQSSIYGIVLSLSCKRPNWCEK